MGAASLREVAVWDPKLIVERRIDGAVLVRQTDPLGAFPLRLSDRIRYWAQVAPERTWMAQRREGEWTRVSYFELLDQVRRMGSFLLTLNLSAQRPLIILSENSLEHAIVALAAQYIGVPSAAITPAYSLHDPALLKLRDVSAQITPGAVFVQSADRFAAAISQVFPNIPFISVEDAGSGQFACGNCWSDAMSCAISGAVDAANEATDGQTVAKFLFTSGTTGSPKAVIQTQEMLCSNMEMVRDCFRFVEGTPPILVDWAPWSHVASGNMVFNFAIYNGGTYYIDHGKPIAGQFSQSVANLRDISPTWYFNVPVGFDLLCEAMEADRTLAHNFFSRLQMIMYAGAGMAAHTWERLNRLAERAMGERVLTCTGLGSTETAPFALFCTDPQDGPGNVGLPMRGVTIKLVPVGDKLELRVKGPNVTPGYWRQPALTAESFDEENFYKMGDALLPVDFSDFSKGFRFDGRTAENFKLESGTWVAVGAVRARLIDGLQGLAKDAAICGENRPELAAIIVPDRLQAEHLVTDGANLRDDELFAHPQVLAEIEKRLLKLGLEATGSSSKVARAIVLTTPLNPHLGEITEKGSLNQRALLRNRPHLLDQLYNDDGRLLRAENGKGN